MKARVIPLYDPDALEFFLSGLPAEARTILLEEFFTTPGAENKSIPQFSGAGTHHPGFVEALRAVFAPLHRMDPDLAKRYPFDES